MKTSPLMQCTLKVRFQFVCAGGWQTGNAMTIPGMAMPTNIIETIQRASFRCRSGKRR